MTLTKRSAKQALGLKRDAQLADFFGISRQAVSKWAANDPLPEGRQWQVRAMRPELFKREGRGKQQQG